MFSHGFEDAGHDIGKLLQGFAKFFPFHYQAGGVFGSPQGKKPSQIPQQG